MTNREQPADLSIAAQIIAAMVTAGATEKEWNALTHDSGPYDITRPNGFTERFAAAILATQGAPKAAAATEAQIDEYLDGYVYEGDMGSYTPGLNELAVIKDAIMGLPEGAPKAEAPARNWQAVEKRAQEYVEEYEYDDGEGGCHSPSELERIVLLDALMGLLADDEFVAALGVPKVEALTDAQILTIASNEFPRWSEDIQPQFVIRLVRAALAKVRP